MKYTAALLALVATVVAAPADIESRNSGSCDNNQTQVCCNVGLTCFAQIIGDSCTGSTYCCETGAPAGTLLNISALNCIQL
ncbi:hypothetical protein JDV02_008959 [Purpureocillium takamizusanense]|uniref:Hydrophobin 3 n=1 Tax=Purpureocillium takamizusanense TaxID=2060973 RepID=A0A9Q8VF80_9HYPO|nr:uncharacterized protein JDV02_008959 [Purpureocillium takamizusanense]UNI23121.1 hypothetical protein JDV02_008959 [Purpureocillium takamizusanense]